MSKPLIYLAGPISGLTYDDSTQWRSYVQDRVGSKFDTASPMRCKEFLNTGETIDDLNRDIPNPLTSARGIMTRDSWDVHRCDALFVYLIGATKVSIGTVMEMAWAWKAGIPAVVVMENNNIHQHIMLQQSTPFYTDNLHDGVQLLHDLF